MSPVSLPTREQNGGRPIPVLPFPTLPLPLDMRTGRDREIVVDWQLPSDVERNN
jgi:hypothetical protein